MYQHTYNSHKCSSEKHKVAIKKKGNNMVKVEDIQSESVRSCKEENTEDTEELHKIVADLRRELNELKEQPRVHIDNLTVITDDIFTKMTKEMGQENAVNFLLEASKSDTECLDVVNKVYLSSSDRDKYPIACKDRDHFRFLGPNSNVIDDIGGKLIVSKLTQSVQDAMIKASSQLLTENDDENVDRLLDRYNILSLQEKLTSLPSEDNKARLKRELAIKVRNPSHPFFRNEKL